MNNNSDLDYDLVIIGAGVSGAAQFYTTALYTDIPRTLLVEKEVAPGLVNSAPTQNSQTLHEGDIETNYTLAKATAVKHKALFTRRYLENRKSSQQGTLYVKGPKMVLGTNSTEVNFLEKRFAEFTTLFPSLQKLTASELARVEPRLVTGRAENQPLLALYNPDGLTINYGALASELITDAANEFSSQPNRIGTVEYNTKAAGLQRISGGFSLLCNGKKVTTRYISVCAGAHSMYFAKQLGIAAVDTKSLLLVAGNFYYTPKFLNAKVYTLQNPKLPFAAVHGDPDILNQTTHTRYGPTTKIVWQLERRKWKTVTEYFSTLTPMFGSLAAYVRILMDKEFFFYALKHNLLFSLPILGRYLFLKEIQKIIPTARYQDVSLAKGQGGVRPQIVETSLSQPLSLGEAKLVDNHVRFNVTPSPGATTCVFNGLVDIEAIAKELGNRFNSDKVADDFNVDSDLQKY